MTAQIPPTSFCTTPRKAGAGRHRAHPGRARRALLSATTLATAVLVSACGPGTVAPNPTKPGPALAVTTAHTTPAGHAHTGTTTRPAPNNTHPANGAEELAASNSRTKDQMAAADAAALKQQLEKARAEASRAEAEKQQMARRMEEMQRELNASGGNRHNEARLRQELDEAKEKTRKAEEAQRAAEEKVAEMKQRVAQLEEDNAALRDPGSALDEAVNRLDGVRNDLRKAQEITHNSKQVNDYLRSGKVGPGHMYHNDTDHSYCSFGWNVKMNSQPSQRYNLTAGHCGKPGDVISVRDASGKWNVVGTFAVSNYSEDEGLDLGLIKLNSNAELISGFGPTRWMDPEEIDVQSNDAKFCRFGSRTGHSCGYGLRTDKHFIVHYGVIDHGDSGGPTWIEDASGNTYAVGVATANAVRHTTFVRTSVAYPFIERYGLQLVN